MENRLLWSIKINVGLKQGVEVNYIGNDFANAQKNNGCGG